MKKIDFFTMLYQFIAVGSIFFIASIENFSNLLTGKIIYPLEFLEIYIGFSPGFLAFFFISFLGIFGLIIQREIYLRQQIKKAIEPYNKK